MQRSTPIHSGTTIALGLAAAPAAAQEASHGFLSPMGPIASVQLTELIWASLIIMVAVLPVLIATPWVLWRYRRDNENAAYRPDWGFSHRLEMLQWGIPTLIVIALSLWLAQAVFLLDPYREMDAEMAAELGTELTGPPVRVDVIGLDWKWLFIYPDEGIASVGEMMIPTGHPVQMRLTTDTVMQSFMAPGLAGQIYAMAGMRTRLSLLADQEGTTQILNTQYNGPGFSNQRSPLTATDRDSYDEWIATAQESPVLDDEAYAILGRSGDVAAAIEDLGRETGMPLTFTLSEDQRYFDRVLMRYMGNDAVAPENQPGSPSYTADPEALPDLPPGIDLHAAIHGDALVPRTATEETAGTGRTHLALLRTMGADICSETGTMTFAEETPR